MVHGRKGEFRSTHLPIGDPQTIESLRTGDFMYQVAVDVNQRRLVLVVKNQVLFPDAVIQSFAGHRLPLAALNRSSGGRPAIYIDQTAL